MSIWDSIQEATPTWLGGTGGNLTAADKAALTQQGIAQIEDVRSNADYFFGIGSDAAEAAAEAADYNESLTPGDVNAVAELNAKANGQCSLLSVVNGQAPFNVCYPQAKYYLAGLTLVFVLWLMAPYVSILSGLRRNR